MATTRVSLKLIGTCTPRETTKPYDSFRSYEPGDKYYTLIDGNNVYDLTKEQFNILWGIVSNQKLDGEAKEERLKVIDECS